MEYSLFTVTTKTETYKSKIILSLDYPNEGEIYSRETITLCDNANNLHNIKFTISIHYCCNRELREYNVTKTYYNFIFNVWSGNCPRTVTVPISRGMEALLRFNEAGLDIEQNTGLQTLIIHFIESCYFDEKFFEDLCVKYFDEKYVPPIPHESKPNKKIVPEPIIEYPDGRFHIQEKTESYKNVVTSPPEYPCSDISTTSETACVVDNDTNTSYNVTFTFFLHYFFDSWCHKNYYHFQFESCHDELTKKQMEKYIADHYFDDVYFENLYEC